MCPGHRAQSPSRTPSQAHLYLSPPPSTAPRPYRHPRTTPVPTGHRHPFQPNHCIPGRRLTPTSSGMPCSSPTALPPECPALYPPHPPTSAHPRPPSASSPSPPPPPVGRGPPPMHIRAESPRKGMGVEWCSAAGGSLVGPRPPGAPDPYAATDCIPHGTRWDGTAAARRRVPIARPSPLATPPAPLGGKSCLMVKRIFYRCPRTTPFAIVSLFWFPPL